MTIAQSQAYQEHLPKAQNKRQIVYEAIAAESLDGLTCREIEGGLGWRPSCVSSRVSELADDGLIKEDGIRRNETVWIAAANSEQEFLRAQRLIAKGKRGEISAVIAIGDVVSLTIIVPRYSKYHVGQKVRIA